MTVQALPPKHKKRWITYKGFTLSIFLATLILTGGIGGFFLYEQGLSQQQTLNRAVETLEHRLQTAQIELKNLKEAFHILEVREIPPPSSFKEENLGDYKLAFSQLTKKIEELEEKLTKKEEPLSLDHASFSSKKKEDKGEFDSPAWIPSWLKPHIEVQKSSPSFSSSSSDPIEKDPS